MRGGHIWRFTGWAVTGAALQAGAQVRQPSLIAIDFGGTTTATAISADGGRVVGYFQDPPGGPSHAFAFPSPGGFVAPDPARATGVSADGSVIFGFVPGAQAFRWTEATGVELLNAAG